MAALPSRVATLVTTNTAIVRETNRVADLPVNIFRLFVFVRDLFIADEKQDKPVLCRGVEATDQSDQSDQSEEGRSRGEFLDSS